MAKQPDFQCRFRNAKVLAISLKRKELLDYDDVCDTAAQCYAWVTQPEHMKGTKDEVKEASRAAD